MNNSHISLLVENVDSTVSLSSLVDHGAVNASKAPGSNRPNKSISSLAFTNSDGSPFPDFDYEYMKLMANRGLYCQHNLSISLKFCWFCFDRTQIFTL